MVPTPAEIASAAKGGLWITKKAADLVAAYRARKIAFVQDPEQVQVIKEARGTAEFKTLAQFASGRQRVLLQVGLGLRRVADNPVEIDNLRRTIITNFELGGWHLAQAAEHGALTLIHQTLLDSVMNEQEFGAQMRGVLTDIDRFVFFVQEAMDAGMEATALLGRLRRDSPMVFVIAALGRARETASELIDSLGQTELGYEMAKLSGKWTDSYILTPEASGHAPTLS